MGMGGTGLDLNIFHIHTVVSSAISPFVRHFSAVGNISALFSSQVERFRAVSLRDPSFISSQHPVGISKTLSPQPKLPLQDPRRTPPPGSEVQKQGKGTSHGWTHRKPRGRTNDRLPRDVYHGTIPSCRSEAPRAAPFSLKRRFHLIRNSQQGHGGIDSPIPRVLCLRQHRRLGAFY